MIIYKITNLVNGKIYIGQTIRSLPDRIHQHLYRQETLVAKAILKYGIENFKIEQIEECDCKDDLNAREIYWIKHSDEIKRKISENRKGLGCRKVINLNTNEIFDSIQDACKKYNLLDGSISRVCSGKYKTSGGFKWAYVN